MRKITERNIQLVIATLLTITVVIVSNFLGQLKTIGDGNREDLRLIVKNLEINHPNLFLKGNRESFYALRDEILENADNMGDKDFYFNIRRLLSLLKDGHTLTYRYDDKYSYTYLKGLPVSFRKFNDSWLLDKVPEDLRVYIGSELVSINERPIGEVLRAYKSYISYDNDFNAEAQFMNEESLYSFLERESLVNKNEGVKIKIIFRGNEEEITVNPYSLDKKDEIKTKDIQSEYPLVTYKTEDNFRYTALSNKVYFIQVNNFNDSPGKPFSDFAKKVSYEIGRANYNAVVIDLRYCYGGDSKYIYSLLEEIKDLQGSMAFDVYTLTSEGTFSTGVTAAYEFRDKLKAKIVGTPTGGNINSFTDNTVIQLNYHNFQVYCPTKTLDLLKGYGGQTLYPNVEIQSSYKDVRYGIDTLISWISSKY